MTYATGSVGGAPKKHFDDIGDLETGPTGTYLLFGWNNYDAGGGIADFLGTYSTVGDAMAAFKNAEYDSEYAGGHIVTYKDGKFTEVVHRYREYDSKKRKVLYGWRRPR